ncbi:MAG: DUF1636 domain-containing protein [Alphaproteobacteria bacterium]
MTNIKSAPSSATPTLYVCTNCPNERKQDTPCTLSLTEGATLYQTLQAAAVTHPALQGATVQPVKCMGGCETPCSVAFAAPGKESLLFTTMDTTKAADILTCFATYVANPAGHRLTKPERPDSLKNTLSARIPAPFISNS